MRKTMLLAAALAVFAGTMTLLVRADTRNEGFFPDVPASGRFAEEVRYATDRNWFIGYPDGTFRPEQTITGTQAAEVIRRMFPDGLTREQFASFVRGGETRLVGGRTLPPQADERTFRQGDDRRYDRERLYGFDWTKQVDDVLKWDTAGCLWAFYASSAEPQCFTRPNRDHLVPLGDVHRSGGYAWDEPARRRFYLDVRNLFVLDEEENIRKSDFDPAEWLPTRNVCRYLETWIDIKNRYGLAADADELAAIRQGLTECPTGGKERQ